jgi:hypothetical protein
LVPGEHERARQLGQQPSDQDRKEGDDDQETAQYAATLATAAIVQQQL